MSYSLNLPFGFLLCTTSAFAQHARTPVFFSDSVEGDVQIATAGDRTLAVWSTDGGRLQSSISDGRGLTWSAPVRVDSTIHVDSLESGNGSPTVIRVGALAYAVWRDGRAGTFNESVGFNRSLDGGASWEADRLLPRNGSVPSVRMRDFSLAIGALASNPSVHVLEITRTSSGDDDLVLTSSTDAGATFGNAVDVATSNGGAGQVFTSAIAAEGATVHCGWIEHRGGWQVIYRRSDDDGATFGVERRVDLTSPTDPIGPIRVACRGSLVVLAWMERISFTPITEDREIRVAVSTDGGQTFAPDRKVGGYPATGTTLFGFDLELRAGNVVVGYHYGQPLAAVSTDQGVSFADIPLAPGLGENVEFASDSDASGRLVAVWRSGGFPFSASAAHSFDGGLTWSAPLEVNTTGLEVFSLAAAYNARYDNVVVGLFDSAGSGELHVGGYRPQYVRANNLVAGATNATFSLAGFQPGAPRNGWVLAAFHTGQFVLPGDGRDLGLARDSLLSATIRRRVTFATTIDASGAGVTGSLAVPPLPGLTFYAAALSFDQGPLVLHHLTDAIPFTVQ
ncbi:MAG: sialidase family protein [Planctomycetota bacterium]